MDSQAMNAARKIDRANHLKRTESMVGTIQGYDSGNLYLSAGATGGDSSDSIKIPHTFTTPSDRLPRGKFADGQKIAVTRDHQLGDKFHQISPSNPDKHGDWPGA